MSEPLIYLAYLTFSSELVIMPPVESTVPVEFLPSFVDGVRLKDGCLTTRESGREGEYRSLAGI